MTRPVAVLGYGVTGRSAVTYLLAQGHDVLLLDTRPAPDALPAELSQVACYWQCEQWPGAEVDYAVVSPGLSLHSCLVQSTQAAGIALRSDIDVFFAENATTPVVGITGTNGKSTVTSLFGHLLNANACSCGVGGNLGEAALNLLQADRDCYALELSSFQLERSATQPFHMATILNISEDHLDQHGAMQDYVAAKQRIYASARRALFNRDDAATQPGDRAGVSSFGSDAPPTATDWGIGEVQGVRWVMHGTSAVCEVEQLPLSGGHNELNVVAACALAGEFISDQSIARALGSFTGLAHRFELVRQTDQVRFINDSKATNVGATLAALNGLARDSQVVLIAGGDAKSADLGPLGAAFRDRVCYLVTLGVDGPAIGAVAQQAGISTEHVSDMSAAVKLASEKVPAPGLVLLSPACASLDMYTSFAARGEAFVRAVSEVTEVAGRG